MLEYYHYDVTPTLLFYKYVSVIIIFIITKRPLHSNYLKSFMERAFCIVLIIAVICFFL